MSQEYSPPPPATSRVRVVLVGAWAVLTAAAASFAILMGSNVPAAEEWANVTVLTGNEPGRAWLWAAPHGFPTAVPKLAYLVSFRLSHDFRTAAFLQVALLSGLSFWLMRVAARLRGRPEAADAFFPVSLLHLGFWENYLIGSRLDGALFAAIAMAMGVVAVRSTRETARRSLLIGAGLLVLLALCGGTATLVNATNWLSAWPAFGFAFLVAVKRGGRWGKWLPLAFCAIAALLFPTNTITGLSSGTTHWGQARSLEADARSGLPAAAIAERHLDGAAQRAATEGIPMLRAARVGAFAEGGR